ncbi:MAG: tyrosine/phenylalanine carboxypeptidase domain-containing protein, partial [Actinomycetota bacterium]
LSLPAGRVEALIQHEVGTHVVTYANGGTHRLQMLRVGPPGYEETQEALAVFSEYAVGGLTRARLIQLAARVAAVDGLVRGGSFTEVFSTLTKGHGIAPKAAFQIAARVFRSGGLTKDAIYLRGISALLDYLESGGPLEPLFIGKLPLGSIKLVGHLRDLGLVSSPPLRPRWADEPAAQPRIAAARRGLGVVGLVEKEAA